MDKMSTPLGIAIHDLPDTLEMTDGEIAKYALGQLDYLIDLKQISRADEKVFAIALMKIAVQAACNACRRDDCEPDYERLIDLCRDAFNWAADQNITSPPKRH